MRLSIENLVAHLFLFGAFVGSEFSVGRHTPAVPDGYTYEVCAKNGTPVLLCHDEVQAAVWFDRIAFEDGFNILAPTLEEGYAAMLPSAEDIEADRKEERFRDIHWMLQVQAARRKQASA